MRPIKQQRSTPAIIECDDEPKYERMTKKVRRETFADNYDFARRSSFVAIARWPTSTAGSRPTLIPAEEGAQADVDSIVLYDDKAHQNDDLLEISNSQRGECAFNYFDTCNRNSSSDSATQSNHADSTRYLRLPQGRPLPPPPRLPNVSTDFLVRCYSQDLSGVISGSSVLSRSETTGDSTTKL